MSERFDGRIRAGGDPRGHPDYLRLGAEMARLGHPACPDVDWRTVEQCCLALFNSNGADLQTAAAYALARGHLAGLEGMSEGVEVIATLLRAGSKPWPRGVSARAEILSGLFSQWQVVLREMQIDASDLAGLNLLNVQLEQWRHALRGQIPVPIRTLDGLCQRVAQLASRIERDAQAMARVAQATPAHTRPRAKKHRGLLIGLLIATLLSLFAALAWQ